MHKRPTRRGTKAATNLGVASASRRTWQWLLACWLPLLGLTAAQAQTVPDAGSLLRQVEPVRTAPLPAPKQVRPAPPPLQMPGQAAVTVRRFTFAGNTLLDSLRLEAAVAEFLNKPLSFTDLQRAAAAAADAYRDAGWVVRTYLPQQDVTAGTVSIQVVEAQFGQVRIEGEAKRVSEVRLRRMVDAAQATGKPVSGPALDRVLLLIDDLPGIKAKGSLAEGAREGETDLLLQVTDGPLYGGDAAMDNTGSRSTGEYRLTANAALNSPTGRSDLGQVMAMLTEGSEYLRLAYSLPVQDKGWRVGANLSHMNYRLLGSTFAAAQARGNSDTMGLEANYSWLRSTKLNVNFSAALDSKHFDNQSAGVTSTRYSTLGLTGSANGQLFDEWQGGGSSAASLALTLGNVDLSGSPNAAADAASTRTAGGYARLRYAVSRQQVINDRWQVYGSLNGQFASNNLDSSEKFYLGGSGGVRAYPSSEGGGSDGMLLALEARARLENNLGVTAFFDYGSVRVNHNNAITGAAKLNSYALKGVGVSASWVTPQGINVKGTLAQRLGHNPNATSTGRDQDGSLIRTRLWLQASLPF